MEQTALITAFRLRKVPGVQVVPHAHQFYELVYYREGSGETRIGATQYGFRSRSFALIPPGTEHDELYRTAGEVICLGFRQDGILPLTVGRDPEGQLLRVVSAILEESTAQGFGYRDMLRAKLTELAVLLHRLGGQNLAGAKSFEYVVNYLSENYYEKVVLEALAREMNLSYDYFQHRFRQLMGLSPRQFLLQKRLEAAKSLLEKTDVGCTDIAYRCGFANSSQFSMLFRRETGLTPLRYRRQTKNPPA